MRTTTAIVLAAIALFTSNVYAKPPTVVYPTGIFPTDVQNVQAAINQGGTVLLKATDTVGHPLAFNFGPRNTSRPPGLFKSAMTLQSPAKE